MASLDQLLEHLVAPAPERKVGELEQQLFVLETEQHAAQLAQHLWLVATAQAPHHPPWPLSDWNGQADHLAAHFSEPWIWTVEHCHQHFAWTTAL